MKVAMTLDGRIAPPPGKQTAREPYWITNEASRASVQTVRWHGGCGADRRGHCDGRDPLITDRSGGPRRRPLLRVVLDSALRMPLDQGW